MRPFGIIIALYLSLAMHFAVAGAPVHKTYSGKFGNGTATYTYLDAPDGSRIFDGRFTWRVDNTVLTGNMKNDLQVGTWTYTDSEPDLLHKTKLKSVDTFTFDDNGMLSGPTSRKVYFKNGKVIETESVTLDEGWREGPYKSVSWHNTRETVTGQYHRNKRVGKWRFTYVNRDPVTVDYDQLDGSTPLVIRYDNTTGDTHAGYDWDYRDPETNEYRYYAPMLLRKSDIALALRMEMADLLRDLVEPGKVEDFFVKKTDFTPDTYVPDTTAIVRCMIEKDGSVSSVRVIDGVNATVDSIVKRIFVANKFFPPRNNPDWWPSTDGPCRKFVRVKVDFPDYVMKSLVKAREEKAFADSIAAAPHEPAPVEAADEMPKFPGGEAEMMKFLANHIRYPQTAAENNVQGRVIVRFVVNSDGSIGYTEVVKGRSPDLDKEAVRVVKKFPKFTPGKNGGKAVPVWYTCPVTFKLQGM